VITPEYLARSGTEDGEQAALFCWAAQNRMRYPQLKWMFAIPNGGARTPSVAARLKATGVKPGVADICLPVPSRVRVSTESVVEEKFSGLFIEMKRKDGRPSDVKPEQREFIRFVVAHGYYAEVAFGWLEAVMIIERYLNGADQVSWA
jgi:hypothetical protein